MKRKNYRILPGILAVTLAVSLCACGSDSTTSTSSNGTKAAETTTVAATETTVTDENNTASNEGESTETDEITLTSGEEYELAQQDVFQTYATSVDTFTEEDIPFYIDSPEVAGTLSLYFLNGIRGIPYISIDDMVDLLTALYTDDTEGDANEELNTESTEAMEIAETLATEENATECLDSSEEESLSENNTGNSYNLSMECMTEDGMKSYILVRENNSEMIVDFNDNVITITDIDKFTALPDAVNGMDVVALNNNGGNQMLKHLSSAYKQPDILTIDLNHYGIFPVFQDGVGYLPLQTFNDILMNRIGARFYYNGESVILSATMLETLEEDGSSIYYSVEQSESSEEQAIFNYNELCMALDYSYGLQDEHNISSFNQLFMKTDLYQQLSNTNPDDTFFALFSLCTGYLADGHSAIQTRSCYSRADVITTLYEYIDLMQQGVSSNMAANYSISKQLDTEYMEARSNKYPDGVPGYEEIGDTAYVTFDIFQYDSNRDYYHTEITNNPDDTLELILYANEQIHREGSPVKNIVLDLSNNIGGELDTGAAVISWMVGKAQIALEDTISGAEGTCSYKFDANLNGIIGAMDEEDNVRDYNLYCLTSSVSFSCGNLVPAALKASGIVTILGKATTGGACAVMDMTTADGNCFQISGPRRLNIISNGSYNSVDQGVQPDVTISKMENFYDREYLTEMIDNLP